MSFHPLVGIDSGLVATQNYQVLELLLTGAAPGTTGAQQPLSAVQGSASPKVFVAFGGTSDSTAVATAFTSAKAQALVQAPNYSAINSQTLLGQTYANLAVGVRTYVISVAAAADAARCIVFAVGGINAADILEAELSWETNTATGAQATRRITQRGPSLNLGDTVAINGSSQLLQLDGSTAVTIANSLVSVKGVILGSFALADADTAGMLPTASAPMNLKLKLRN
jgi:hypothetical protein